MNDEQMKPNTKNNAINWLVGKCTPMEDWPNSGIFTGRLPYRMVKEILKFAEENGGTWRDGQKTAIINFAIHTNVSDILEQDYDYEIPTRFAITHGCYKSTYCNVQFQYMHDYEWEE